MFANIYKGYFCFSGRRSGVSTMSINVPVAGDGPARVVLAQVLRALLTTVPCHRDFRGKGSRQLPCVS